MWTVSYALIAALVAFDSEGTSPGFAGTFLSVTNASVHSDGLVGVTLSVSNCDGSVSFRVQKYNCVCVSPISHLLRFGSSRQEEEELLSHSRKQAKTLPIAADTPIEVSPLLLPTFSAPLSPPPSLSLPLLFHVVSMVWCAGTGGQLWGAGGGGGRGRGLGQAVGCAERVSAARQEQGGVHLGCVVSSHFISLSAENILDSFFAFFVSLFCAGEQDVPLVQPFFLVQQQQMREMAEREQKMLAMEVSLANIPFSQSRARVARMLDQSRFCFPHPFMRGYFSHPFLYCLLWGEQKKRKAREDAQPKGDLLPNPFYDEIAAHHAKSLDEKEAKKRSPTLRVFFRFLAR